jgi:hypothetical protein
VNGDAILFPAGHQRVKVCHRVAQVSRNANNKKTDYFATISCVLPWRILKHYGANSLRQTACQRFAGHDKNNCSPKSICGPASNELFMKNCPQRNLAVVLVAPYSVRLLPPLAIATLISLFLHAYAEGETRVLSGHVPATAAVAQPVGRLAPSRRLSLAIGVPLRDRDGLTNFLAQVYDPASPLYHQYLSLPQFTARFGPTAEDYQNVLEFARANGFQITGVHPNRMLVDVNASVSDIERAFHLNLRVYRHPSESRDFYAPDTEPAVDVSLPVLHVSGLDNCTRPRPASLRQTSSGNGSNPVPFIGTGPGGSYQGKDFRRAYASGVTLTGVGQMVGLLEFDGFAQSDITSYELEAGLPNVPIETVLTDGADGSAGANDLVVDLDIEMVISMAPGVSRVIVYEGDGVNGLPDDILNRMATDNLAKQLSGSWSFDTDATTPQILMQFAAQGQTYFNGSGDDGAYVGAPYQGPFDPYITLVGGTTLSTDPSGAWVSETVWRYGMNSSGGGVTTNSIPSWQQGLNMSTNNGSTSFRNSPDVAMVADNVWVQYNGTGRVVGGAACASPLWAGFIALVNQQAVSLGKPTVGFLNPAIYAIGIGAGYATNFHDITVGNNTNAGSPGLYYAVAGYDLCTGWGSPIGQALIDTLAPRVKAPVVANAGATLIAEGCVPNNGVIDPGETVTVNFALKNLGAFQTTNLVASLQSDSGVVLPSGPQPYGALSAGGAAVNRPFTFTANAPCGGMLTATLLLTDGQANLGAATFDFPIGKSVTVMAQNFDSVTAPALPSGWTSATISNAANWVTSSNAKDSGLISAFAPEPPTPGVAELTAPPVQITTPTAQLIFQNYYNTETDPTVSNVGMAYDGGVLEIQIGTNAFTDILAAGGSFVTGGYNQTIQITDDNPLDGRQVWSGNSGGFIPTVVNLPATAAGKTIQLKWRFGTDSLNYYGGLGWYIDTISINDGYACCNSSAPPSLSIDSAHVSATNVIVSLHSVVGVTYTLQYKNSLQDSTWTDILPSVPGTDGVLLLHDTNGSLLSSRFYRVRSN